MLASLREALGGQSLPPADAHPSGSLAGLWNVDTASQLTSGSGADRYGGCISWEGVGHSDWEWGASQSPQTLVGGCVMASHER